MNTQSDNIRRHLANALAAELQKFVQLTNALAVSITEEQVSESIKALTSHCHSARTALAAYQAAPETNAPTLQLTGRFARIHKLATDHDTGDFYSRLATIAQMSSPETTASFHIP